MRRQAEMKAPRTMLAVMGCLLFTTTEAGAAGTIRSTTGVDGFAASDTGDLHAVLVTVNNRLDEITWKPGVTPVVTTLRVEGQPIIGVAGFYSPIDGHRHAIVALADNTIYEYWYDKNFNAGIHPLPSFPSSAYGRISSVAAHVSHDNYQNVVVGTEGGYLFLSRWYPNGGVYTYGMYHSGFRIDDVASTVDDNGVNHAVFATNYDPGTGGYPNGEWYLAEIQWTSPGAFTAHSIGYGPGEWMFGGIGALNWLANTVDIAYQLPSIGTVPGNGDIWDIVGNSPWSTHGSSHDDLADPWGSVATGAFYEANGWCPNRHFLIYTGGNTLLDYHDNACFPGWVPTTLGNQFDF